MEMPFVTEQNRENVNEVLSAARTAVEKISMEIPNLCRVAFVTCSYDTAFEPVTNQVEKKIEQLIDAYGLDGPVQWSLWVVDDLPAKEQFSAQVRAAFRSAPARLNKEKRLRLIRLRCRPPTPGGVKGQALLDGMATAVDMIKDLSAIVYINLNLKVDVISSAIGLLFVLNGECDVAVGTRAPKEGGKAIGTGISGRLKSRGFNLITRSLLPELSDYYDTNAPLKIFSLEAARCLVENARLPWVTMDCEWLLLMHSYRFKVSKFPILWIQREGSIPPWHLAPKCFRDVLLVRHRWRKGLYNPSADEGFYGNA